MVGRGDRPPIAGPRDMCSDEGNGTCRGHYAPRGHRVHVVTHFTCVVYGISGIQRCQEGDSAEIFTRDLWRRIAWCMAAGHRSTAEHVNAHQADQAIQDGTVTLAELSHQVHGNYVADLFADRGRWEEMTATEREQASWESLRPAPWNGVEDGVPTEDEMLLALNELHDNAPGTDQVRVRDLRSDERLRNALFRMTREVWTSGTAPPAYQYAKVIAIPKHGIAQQPTLPLATQQLQQTAHMYHLQPSKSCPASSDSRWLPTHAKREGSHRDSST